MVVLSVSAMLCSLSIVLLFSVKIVLHVELFSLSSDHISNKSSDIGLLIPSLVSLTEPRYQHPAVGEMNKEVAQKRS